MTRQANRALSFTGKPLSSSPPLVPMRSAVLDLPPVSPARDMAAPPLLPPLLDVIGGEVPSAASATVVDAPVDVPAISVSPIRIEDGPATSFGPGSTKVTPARAHSDPALHTVSTAGGEAVVPAHISPLRGAGASVPSESVFDAEGDGGASASAPAPVHVTTPGNRPRHSRSSSASSRIKGIFDTALSLEGLCTWARNTNTGLAVLMAICSSVAFRWSLSVSLKRALCVPKCKTD
jgi:hypothetical protein